MRLENKAIIVTGSTCGIGAAIAQRIVAEGGCVLIHGLEREAGEKIVAGFPTGRAALHVDDLSDPRAPDRLIAAALSAFGRIDALVNNAAAIVRSNLQTTDAALFDRVMAVNVRAPMLLIKAAAPHLMKTSGAVLNIGSVNGHCGEANLLAYSVSKGALITLSRNLADAMAVAGVRVNHLNLGWVLTANENQRKIADGLAPDWSDHPPRTFAPSGKLLSPEQIAAAAVYWIGDESRPVSGSVVDVEQYPIIGRNPFKES